MTPNSATPQTAWTIRPYQTGDETALVDLFARAFGRPISEAHWRWKLSGRGFNAPTVFVGVTPDAQGRDRPVCQCAGIPVRYRGPHEDVTAVVAVDAMTDADFRRRGLLTEVSRHAYDRWREAGARFVIGLPNQQWGSRARALGWRELFPLAWRIRLLRPDRIAARRYGRLAGLAASPVTRLWNRYWRAKTTRDPAIDVRRVTSSEECDDLWPALEQSRGGRTSYTIVRDRAWLEWRYFSSPDASYKIWRADRAGHPVGYCVSRLRDAEADGRRVGYIAEFAAVGDDAAVPRALLGEATDDLAREGAELVAALAVPRTATDIALRRAGFLVSWGRFSVQAIPLQSDTNLSFSNVHGGDFDVV